MNEARTAAELFAQGFSCSQSVFAAFAGRFGISRDDALKIADGFGGGIGRMGLTCGALTGAVMAISMSSGRTRPEDFESKSRTVAAVRRLAREFEEKFGSTRCSELLGFDISGLELTPGPHVPDPRFEKCDDFVRFACERLSKLLPDQENRNKD